jgi:hypothetical protein
MEMLSNEIVQNLKNNLKIIITKYESIPKGSSSLQKIECDELNFEWHLPVYRLETQ